MSKRIWTEDQKKAISVSGRTVLVAAAAGSGKTASLAERVIKKITSQEDPIDADRLLIVTFTNAAATEMKDRISKLLSDMADKNPCDSNLKRQQYLLKRADICTVHSFCNNIVRDNFYKLGISPNFRIADENEISVIEERAIEKVLSEFYDRGEEDFFKIVELFSGDKDDSGLINVINQIYKFVESCPFPDLWFYEKKKLYGKTQKISDTCWGKVLIKYVSDTALYCEDLIRNAIEMVSSDESLNKFYLDALSAELSGINFIKSSLIDSWDNILHAVQSFAKGHRKRIPKELQDDILVLKIESIRDYVKKAIDKLKKCFAFKESICISDMNKIGIIVNKLFEVTECFICEMSKMKEEKNIAEFSDLEHWMIKLLIEKDASGEFVKSDAAKDISERYDEIMIDEYQDTNEIQDLIFKTISHDEKNMFMVGDVKQSIYGFRQAKPEIFMNKKNEYELYSSSGSSPCKIILAKNFRSREGVIDTVNFIFNKLMSKESAGIDYNQEEELSYGALYEKREEPETTFELVEIQEGENVNVAEAFRISQIISKMISEKYMVKDGNIQRPVTYRDFCILLRSANKHSSDYVKELNEQGIPAWSDTSGKFFGTSEVAVILSLLRLIDNPMQDIPLLAVLVSPIFGFSCDDLSDIRIKMKGVPLYLAVKAMADDNDTKCKAFIRKIDNYRRLCSVITIEKLINYIYADTGYTSVVLAMTNGELRLANLRLLSEYAGKYDGTAYNGLSGFVGFIDKLQEKKADLSPASTISEASNVVKVMSIHRSKGLEFPVCIIAKCSGKFNRMKDNVLIHPSLGTGMILKDESGSVKYTNFIRNAIGLEIEREEMAEELRVLYVAMTRAKEKLIFLVSIKDIAKRATNNICGIFKRGKIPAYMIRNSGNFAEWILNCVFLSNYSKKIYDYTGVPDVFDTSDNNVHNWKINITKTGSIIKEISPERNDLEDDIKLSDEIKTRFEFKYPYSEINHIPVKISASKLANEEGWKDYIAVSRPAFMSDLSVTPTEKGTALHEFLHFADYSMSLQDLDSQLSYLQEKGFLTTKQIEIINKNDVYKFLHSELGQRIIKSKEVQREYRFTVGIPAGDLRDESITVNEKIIVQGAIDCVFKENNEYVIVDYKTDRTKNLDMLREKYSRQLNIYKHAFEICEEVTVKELLVYSLPMGEFIKV